MIVLHSLLELKKTQELVLALENQILFLKKKGLLFQGQIIPHFFPFSLQSKEFLIILYLPLLFDLSDVLDRVFLGNYFLFFKDVLHSLLDHKQAVADEINALEGF